MASPEFKKWFPVVMVPSVLLASIAAAAIGILNMKNGVGSPHDEVFVWPTPSASALPFPTYSASPTPTLIETPSDDVTTPFFEETPTTPVATPTESTSPTPSATRSSSRPSPTNRPTTTSNVTVVRYHYDSTGTHSGLAYIDTATPNNGETQSTEYGVNCTKAVETGAVVMKITSYTHKTTSDTDGELAFHQDPTPYRSLTDALCEGSQVAQSFAGNPGKYAPILSPFAHIS